MTKDIGLHPEKREKVVAFKVTQSEFDAIEKHCGKKGLNVKHSRYIRHVVFTDIGLPTD